ncbi:MAG: type I-E CRISPR-associated protein Cas7/Cse4/CasC [Planctomycetes bacterium]|nr:type I-E CRISPR-associated protein Cas7/Cse4/CasC [Planctomycetota bacterium]
MIVELHLLQNFSPSCLNRDDTNSPKDCEFGSFRRARISSQCIKRTIRQHFARAELLEADHLARRSKRLIAEVAQKLTESGRPEDQASALVKAALAGVKLKAGDDNETQYLLFLGRREIAALAKLVDQHWDTLVEVAEKQSKDESPDEEGSEKVSSRKKKKAAKATVPAEITDQIKRCLDGGKAADLALFGRMVADQPDLNREAACQVAHAISTNRVSMEMDYYTAVDDLKERSHEAGAGMIGTVEFNSACFYRYANIDFQQLVENLQGDTDLALKTVEAFVRASVEAIPTGKQNSMAAQNPPSLVFAVVRKAGFWSLANAFERPIVPDRRDDGLSLVGKSIKALDRYWKRLGDVYGADGILAAAACKVDEQPEFEALKPSEKKNVDQVVSCVLKALANGGKSS